MTGDLRKKLAALLAALLVGGGIVLTVAIDDDGPDGPKPPRTVTIRVDGNDADAKRDDTVKVPAAAVEKVAKSPELDDPLREPGDGKAGVYEGPLAGQEFPGCRNRLTGNFSSRNGRKVNIIVWHQTVSRERGWASQDALTAMAGRLSSGVSWHFLIGRTGGRCTYTVPLNLKAWHGGNANPFSVGIEVEAFGDEGTYVLEAGRSKLLAVTREVGRRFGIPMRRGLVRNCQPVRSGIVEHSDLGVCGGGHIDVTLPGVNTLIRAAARGSAPVRLTNGEKADIRCVKRPGFGNAACEKRLRARNLELHRLGLTSKHDRARRHAAIHAALRRFT